MKSVQVLLSSYNGQTYIRQQLDSILNQKNVDVHCLVRDDGSIDSTIDILYEYQKQHKNLEIIIGNNIGYKASFMQLVNISGEYDYYAFADQDDVWKDDKLFKAIEQASEIELGTAVMYCSNCTLVDNNLNYIEMLHNKETIIPRSKVTALVQGFAHGCTIVLNSSAKNLITKYKIKQDYAHDFWIPLLVLFIGKVIYDKNSYILYRQHDSNVFGSRRSIMRIIKIKIMSLISKNHQSDIIHEILKGYGDHLTYEDYNMLEEISHYKSSLNKKIKLIFNKEFKKNTFKGTLFLKFLILFSWY